MIHINEATIFAPSIENVYECSCLVLFQTPLFHKCINDTDQVVINPKDKILSLL